MAVKYSGQIVTDGLVLALDAASLRSYPGSGTTWYDISGNDNHYTFGANLSYDATTRTFSTIADGGAGAGGINSTAITTNSSCTLVLWVKTTDTQALFWGSSPPSHGGSYYVGAYSSGNKEYYGNCGTPDYYQDLSQPSNIYDNIRDGNWHMVEFKNVNFSTWTNQHNFNSYGSFQLTGNCGQILIYNRNISNEESTQNYNATKGRFD